MRACLVAILLVVSACEDGHHPSRPGGGTGSGSTDDPDAASDDDGGGAVDGGGERRITGSVCLVDDLRDPTDCASEPSGVDLLISGTEIETTTTAGGNFSLLLDDTVENGVVYLVVGFEQPTYHLSLVPILVDDTGASNVSAPVMLDVDYDALRDVVIGDDLPLRGTVALYLEDGVAPAVGAIVDTTADTPFVSRYDTADPTIWVADGGTGAFGATLLFGIAEGDDIEILATSAEADQLALSPILVVEDSLTFLRERF